MKSKTLEALLDYDYVATGRVVRAMKAAGYIDARKFFNAHLSEGLAIWKMLKKGIVEVPQNFVPQEHYIKQGYLSAEIHLFNAVLDTNPTLQQLSKLRQLVHETLLIELKEMPDVDGPPMELEEYDVALIGYYVDYFSENPAEFVDRVISLFYSLSLGDLTDVYFNKAGIDIEPPSKAHQFQHFTAGRDSHKLKLRSINNKLITHIRPDYDPYNESLDSLVNSVAAADGFIYEIFYDELTQPAISPYALSGATFKQLTRRSIAKAVEGLLVCSSFDLVRCMRSVNFVIYDVDIHDDHHTYFRTGIQLQEISLAKHLMTLPNHNPIKSTLATTLFKYGVLSIPYPEALRANNIFETEVATIGAYYLNVYGDLDGLARGLRDFLRSCSAHDFCVSCVNAGTLIMPEELLHNPDSRDLMAIGHELKNQKMIKTLDLLKS